MKLKGTNEFIQQINNSKKEITQYCVNGNIKIPIYIPVSKCLECGYGLYSGYAILHS